MFLTLGLLVFPSDLGDVWLDGTVMALVVVFIARPLATLVSTLGAGFDVREKALLGWAGLRGAVPVVLAIFPFTHGIDSQTSVTFFNIVFFAVLLSTLLQGMTVEPVARWLGVTSPEESDTLRGIVEVGAVRELGGDVIEHVIRPGDAAAGARIRELGLPRDALVSLVARGDEALLPRGSTRLEAGDRLIVLVRREVSRDLSALVVLADGRYAVCGPILMLGPPVQVQAQARRRLARAEDDAAQAWWQEVIGACAL